MGPIVLFALIGLRIISIPIGVGVFILIRRMMPAVTVTSVSIIAGYIVGVVVLFVLIRQVFGLIWYDTASISLVITAGVVFYITYTIKRSLFKPSRSMEAETGFKVFGEDAKQKPKNLRRRKR
jgi:hypothetical protein